MLELGRGQSAEGRGKARKDNMAAINHVLREEPKHSSGDLHSRLKTRKILGVGETDDGDVHRSKLSQILGHSDQLYVKLPYGIRVWQFVLAAMFSAIGLWALILPSHIFHVPLEEASTTDFATLPIRLYGGALISLSLVFWLTLNSQDRDIIRMNLLTSLVYFVIQFVVSALSHSTVSSPVALLMGPYLHAGWRALQLLGSGYFYLVLTRDSRHYR